MEDPGALAASGAEAVQTSTPPKSPATAVPEHPTQDTLRIQEISEPPGLHPAQLTEPHPAQATVAAHTPAVMPETQDGSESPAEQNLLSAEPGTKASSLPEPGPSHSSLAPVAGASSSHFMGSGSANQQHPSSNYHGVIWNSICEMWTARIAHSRAEELLGNFQSEEDAARAYDKAAFRTYGRDTQLNFPEEAGNYKKRRGLAAYDSDPEISAESEDGDGPQDVDDEIAPLRRSDDKEKKKPARRKRPRLVPPHSRSSRYRGVYWEPKGSKWYSSISSNHKQIHLGSFNTEEEAAQAFDAEAIRLRGPGTFTNFPSENYLIGDVDSDTGEPKKPTQRRPPNGIRRRPVKKESDNEEEDRPEKDDQAANALLSLGCSLPRRSSKSKATPRVGSTPPRTIEPPVTLRGQKRKRGGLTGAGPNRTDGTGRARSKFTGVYQQSRGNGWFASICVDKSMRYLGTFTSEEEAARAFDQEAIRLRGTGIELNLPEEAEGFMQKLKEEEEAAAAAGEPSPRRLGPAPIVSAGPDFEEPPPSRLPAIRPGRTGLLTLGGADDNSPRVPRRRRGRVEEEEEQPESGRRNYGRQSQERVFTLVDSGNGLPSWDGRRARSIPRRAKQADKQVQRGPANGPSASGTPAAAMAGATAPALSSLAAGGSMDAAFGSYLSMLAPSVGGVSAFSGPFSYQEPLSGPFQGLAAPEGPAALPNSSPAQTLARPSPSYPHHNLGSLHQLSQPFSSGYGHPLGQFGSAVLPGNRGHALAPTGIKGPLGLRNGSAALQNSRTHYSGGGLGTASGSFSGVAPHVSQPGSQPHPANPQQIAAPLPRYVNDFATFPANLGVHGLRADVGLQPQFGQYAASSGFLHPQYSYSYPASLAAHAVPHAAVPHAERSHNAQQAGGAALQESATQGQQRAVGDGNQLRAAEGQHGTVQVPQGPPGESLSGEPQNSIGVS